MLGAEAQCIALALPNPLLPSCRPSFLWLSLPSPLHPKACRGPFLRLGVPLAGSKWGQPAGPSGRRALPLAGEAARLALHDLSFPRPAQPASHDQPGCHPHPVADVCAPWTSRPRGVCQYNGRVVLSVATVPFSCFAPSCGRAPPVSRREPILGGFPGRGTLVLSPRTGYSYVPSGLTARPRCQTLCPPPSGGAVPWSAGCPPRGPRLTR